MSCFLVDFVESWVCRLVAVVVEEEEEETQRNAKKRQDQYWRPNPSQVRLQFNGLGATVSANPVSAEGRSANIMIL